MTAGLLISFTWAGLSLSMFALSAVFGAAWQLRTAGAILTAYLLVHAAKFSLPISKNGFDILFASIWVGCGMIVSAKAGGDKVTLYGVKSLMSLTGLCYLWARMVDAPRVFGSPPYVLSDVFAVLAMLTIGWTLRDELTHWIRKPHSGGVVMGGDSHFSGGGPADFSSGVTVIAQAKAEKKEGR